MRNIFMGTLRHWRRQAVFPNVKRGRRFAAGCIKRLCSLRSGGDRGKWYSRKQEGSGAFGARVLSVMCCALTDGFRLQSGLVQRGVIKYRGRQQTGCILKCKRGAPLRGRLYRRVMFAALRGQKSGCLLTAVRFPPDTVILSASEESRYKT